MDIKELINRAKKVKAKYKKYEKNVIGKEWSGEQTMEGLVGDIGDLMKLVMAKEGYRVIDNVDEKLSHELSDCLWALLILADKYGVDIEKSFLKTMDKLEGKIKTS